MAPKPVVLDRKIFENLRKLADGKILGKLLGLFMENTPKKIETIMAAYEKKDYQTVTSLAHSLISSAGMLGAVEMKDLAVKIQEAAFKADEAGVSRLVPELNSAYARAKAELIS